MPTFTSVSDEVLADIVMGLMRALDYSTHKLTSQEKDLHINRAVNLIKNTGASIDFPKCGCVTTNYRDCKIHPLPDHLTILVMQVCGCFTCRGDKPCEKTLRAVKAIRSA